MSGGEGSGGPLAGTLPAFVVGLAVVAVAGVVVGRFTESYLAVAFAAYFVTTVYDLTVERYGLRETLLDRVGVDGQDDPSP